MGFTQVPPDQASSPQSDQRLKNLEGFASLVNTPKGIAALTALLMALYTAYVQYKGGPDKVDPMTSALVEIAKSKVTDKPAVHAPTTPSATELQVKQLSDTVTELGKAVKSQGGTVQAIVDMIQKQNDKIDRILPKGKVSYDDGDDVSDDDLSFVQFTKPVSDTAAQVAKLLADRDVTMKRLDSIEPDVSQLKADVAYLKANAVTKADFEAFKASFKQSVPDLPMPQPMPPASPPASSWGTQQAPPTMQPAGVMLMRPMLFPRMPVRRLLGRMAGAGGC